MRSFGLFCFALLLATAPASAAALDTDTDTGTDTGFEPHPPPEVNILSPDDGAVFEGTPDAVVPVEISFTYMQPESVSLHVDDVAAGGCADEWQCTIEVTLSPGVHKLQAIGSDSFVSEVVMVEVRDGSADNSAGTDATTTDADETATDSDGGGGGEKSGCGCSSDGGGPGASGLALLGLLALRRRRAG